MFNKARLENLHIMLTYNFANKGSDSLYEYLYKCIKNDILLGNLGVHEKLPSKRSFAKNLGISVITVENAYEQLMAEGYIYSIPKKGFYVADLRELNLTKTLSVSPSSTLLSFKEKVPYLADFTSNQTDSEIFPFTIWARTMRELLNENQQQLMENPPCGGIMALRQAIADYLHAFRGMVVNPEQIIVGAGTEYLYGLLIQLLGDDKIYGIEDPSYHQIRKVYPRSILTSMVSASTPWKIIRSTLCIFPHPTIFQLVSSHRSAVVMNCLVGLLRMRTVILSKMIMTVNYALAENRSLHCKVLMSLIKSFI